MSRRPHANDWYFGPQQRAAHWCILSGPEERVCRRLKPPIQAPGTLIIWLDSDAKEPHCLTPFKQHHCTEPVWLCHCLQCTSNKCVCVLVCLHVLCFGGIVCDCSVLLYGRVSVCECVCGALCVSIPAACVCISQSRGFSFFSAVDNNVPSHWNAGRQMWPERDPVFLALLPVKSKTHGHKLLWGGGKSCLWILVFETFHNYFHNFFAVNNVTLGLISGVFVHIYHDPVTRTCDNDGSEQMGVGYICIRRLCFARLSVPCVFTCLHGQWFSQTASCF